MSYYLGYIPSEDLHSQCKAIDGVDFSGKEALYPQRDKIALAITAELIDATLISLVEDMPETDTKATILKVANFIKSTVNVLLKQLLGKASNDQVYKSVVFLNGLEQIDSKGSPRIGVQISDTLSAGLLKVFAEMEVGNHQAVATEAVTYLTQLTDVLLHCFMEEFLKTLDLGMIKRKAAEMANSGISKAMHTAIAKLVPKMPAEDAKNLAAHYKGLLYQA